MAGAALVLAGSAEAANLRIDDPTTSLTVQMAVDGAREWLADPGCQAVFSDFRDRSGKLLSDVLAERGESGQSHLDRLFFYDGSRAKLCEGLGAAALTQPGSYIVYVCPAQFRQLSRDRRKAVATVVHELLHTLGLGENPPSPREITAGVLARCGH
jgi:hypothetical protein